MAGVLYHLDASLNLVSYILLAMDNSIWRQALPMLVVRAGVFLHTLQFRKLYEIEIVNLLIDSPPCIRFKRDRVLSMEVSHGMDYRYWYNWIIDQSSKIG